MQAKHHGPSQTETFHMKFQMPQYYAGTKNRIVFRIVLYKYSIAF